MNPVRTIEMDCTHAELLRELPVACGMRPYEIIGERVVVHDGNREVQIKIADRPLRHLGSLNLPVERITFKFVDYQEDEADKFLQDFLRPLER